MYHKAKKHFKKTDEKLYRASLEFEIADIKPSNDLFRDIVWTIIGQQLSGKAADTIFARFETLFPAKNITPQKILKLGDEKMRESGISGAKIRALRDLSTKILSGEVDLNKIYSLSDTDVALELIKVKGIGPWTAEMVLMFSLGRMNIFSTGDLGLKKGLMQLYGWKKLPNEKKLLKTINQWSPYKTYAAKILWKIADKNKTKK